jgi:hypothetical protein
MMKFSEAEAKLAEIAKGEHRFIQYHKVIHSAGAGGRVDTDCQIYINGGPIDHGRTWEEAFKNRELRLNPEHPIEDTPDEIPTEELAEVANVSL